MVNSERIKERLKELGLTQKDAAICMRCAQATASQKINNRRPMYLDEAERLSQLLKIEQELFCTYFFAPEVA